MLFTLFMVMILGQWKFVSCSKRAILGMVLIVGKAVCVCGQGVSVNCLCFLRNFAVKLKLLQK